MNLFEGRKILVVDDDDMLREVMSEIFEAEGAQVTEAKNGTVAFSILQKFKFDVVFSDVRMPGGDGLTLAKNISELTGSKPLVFLCSGYSDLTKENVESLNILKVFDKPFNHRNLIDDVANSLPIRI